MVLIKRSRLNKSNKSPSLSLERWKLNLKNMSYLEDEILTPFINQEEEEEEEEEEELE